MSYLIAKTDIVDELINPVVEDADLAAADIYFDDMAESLDADIDEMSKDTAGYVTGGTGVDDVMSTWTAVTNGSFSITINGVAHDVTTLNFSTGTTMDDIVSIIQTAIRAVASGGIPAFAAATVSYVSTDKHFVITSGTAGALSSVSVLSAAATGTDISGTSYLKLNTGTATATAGTSLPYKVKRLLIAFVCREICLKKASSGGGVFNGQGEKDKWTTKLPEFKQQVQLYESQITASVILGTVTTTASIGVITIERG